MSDLGSQCESESDSNGSEDDQDQHDFNQDTVDDHQSLSPSDKAVSSLKLPAVGKGPLINSMRIATIYLNTFKARGHRSLSNYIAEYNWDEQGYIKLANYDTSRDECSTLAFAIDEALEFHLSTT